MRTVLFVLSCLLIVFAVNAQPCTNPGQTPATAFPVCGTSIFTQNTVPLCGGNTLPSPNCASSGALSDRNPFFYKFTCFQSGKLGFLITPKDLTSDYDWELYDVTGIDPNTIYTNGNLVVSCNWSGETGLTGASSAGRQAFVCAGTGQDLFSSMPNLVAGHNYLLLVSHFTNSQAGYTLEFKGGTAVITDTNVPRLRSAVSNCSGDRVRIKLSKKIKCSSIATDGSDFFVTPGGATTASATGFECNIKFDTDSLEILLDRFLPPGNYTLSVKRGSDGNTLLDYCDNPMPATEVANFTILANAPTPMDSLAKVTCAPSTLRLVFSKPITCASIAANGSDFIINGSYPVSVTAAAGNCAGALTESITLTLSQPLLQAGSFMIELRQGSDGNTLLNECAAPTPAGSFIRFDVKDTVNADFTYNIQYDCVTDVVEFFHPGGQQINTWSWNMDDGQRSNVQNPQGRYTVFGPKNIELIASNGFCSDTVRKNIVLENFLKANFSVFEDNCPLEPVTFTSSSIGKIAGHEWSFGDGNFGTGEVAKHSYARPTRETTFNVRYTVIDSFGCRQTVQKPIKVYSSCTIAVPNAFTPNGDRKNDLLYPLNAVKADNLEFSVFNRWGQLVFRTNSWKRGWDGSFNGQQQPSGTYVWLLRYVNRDTGKRTEVKGFAILVR